jgi:arginine/lysine/ornithine decarboxylase
MSTTYEIVEFAKPTKKELLAVDKFNAYDSFRIQNEDGDDTGWGIYLFRTDDKSVSNLVDSRFAVKMVLPELVTDYEKLYADLGFDDEAIKNKDVHIVKSNNRNMDISDGINTEQINKSMLEDYKVAVQTNCIAIKMKTLWNSGENYIYNLNKEKVIKNIPGIDVYSYVPVNNSMLARAEMPFLIFQKNYGKCFIAMY